MLVALSVLVSCSDDDGAEADPDPTVAPRPVALPGADLEDVGTCRGAVARQAGAGAAMVDWVPLRVELAPEGSVVFMAQSLEDLGERDIYDGGEPIGAADLPRSVRFEDTTALAGEYDPDQELLIDRWAAADAFAQLDAGAELLVWVRPQETGPTYASLAALGPDGAVAFLGDCRPGWTPAFDAYATRQGGGLSAAELLTRIVAAPGGPEAQAFLASPEAEVPAGP